MYIEKSYYNLSNQELIKFQNFLQESSKERSQPAYVNMYDENWKNKPNTLLFLLEKTNRFQDNGYFQVLFDHDKIIACSGMYASQFSKDIAILGCRTWVAKDYRNKMIPREFLLPTERNIAIQRNYKCVILTFNDYNKNLSLIWKRKRFGEKRSDRKSYHFGFNGVTLLDFPVMIQHTRQWVIYENLEKSFDFDWRSIRYE